MRAVVAFVVFIAVIPAAAQQKRWFELYDEAIDHVRKEEWPAAEEKLQQAKKAGIKPGRNVRRYGMLFDDFFPDFYLGVVYLNTARPELARAAFAAARAQKVDVEDAEFRDFAKLEQRAQDMLAALAKPPTKPGAGGTPAANDELPGASGGGGGGEKLPTPADDTRREEEFKTLMQSAELALEQRNYAAAARAAASARKLGLDAGAVDSLLRRIEVARLGDSIQAALARRDVSTTRREIDALAAISSTASELPAFRGRLSALEAELKRDGLEREAVKMFFSGSYQRALRLLEDATAFASLTERGQFYRACSLAALTEIEPNSPSNARRLADARAFFVKASGDSARFARDRNFISPKLLQLLAR